MQQQYSTDSYAEYPALTEVVLNDRYQQRTSGSQLLSKHISTKHILSRRRKQFQDSIYRLLQIQTLTIKKKKM
jgi:hypothetical protein